MTRDDAIAECRRLMREHGVTEEALLAAPAVKFTRCPSIGYDPRYQLAPGARTPGCGFAAAGIGRDIETGRDWA